MFIDIGFIATNIGGDMLCQIYDCANYVVCDEIISFFVISWKHSFSERHFLADETAHRTESLPKINKLHIILFGIPDYSFVRNIPRHVRALRVRASPVGADILRIEKCQLPFFFFYLLNNLHFYTLHVGLYYRVKIKLLFQSFGL